ncbi:MAG: hypothetical protein WBR15_10890 [Gammaproteobacteria bacterium]
MPRTKGCAPAVGHVKCPTCGDLAVVRKKASPSNLLYVWCGECGWLNLTMPKGQDWILNNAVIWKDRANPPAELPAWIRENRAWSHPPRGRDDEAPDPKMGDSKGAGGGEMSAPAVIQEEKKPAPAPKVVTQEEAGRVDPVKKKPGLFDGGLFDE